MANDVVQLKQIPKRYIIVRDGSTHSICTTIRFRNTLLKWIPMWTSPLLIGLLHQELVADKWERSTQILCTEHMPTKHYFLSREKYQGMQVNASGWLDPEKAPGRLKPLGGTGYSTWRTPRDTRVQHYHTLLFQYDQIRSVLSLVGENVQCSRTEIFGYQELMKQSFYIQTPLR